MRHLFESVLSMTIDYDSGLYRVEFVDATVMEETHAVTEPDVSTAIDLIEPLLD